MVLIDASQLYCPQIRMGLFEVLEELMLPFHASGTFACTEGPRFETPAEIRMIERLGGYVSRLNVVLVANKNEVILEALRNIRAVSFCPLMC